MILILSRCLAGPVLPHLPIPKSRVAVSLSLGPMTRAPQREPAPDCAGRPAPRRKSPDLPPIPILRVAPSCNTRVSALAQEQPLWVSPHNHSTNPGNGPDDPLADLPDINITDDPKPGNGKAAEIPFDDPSWIDPKAKPLVLSPNAPLVSARRFIQQHHIKAGQRALHHQQDAFYAWQRTHYAEVAEEVMRGAAVRLPRQGGTETKAGMVAFNPNKAKVENVLEATAAEAQLPSDARPPAWLDTRSRPPADELIACTNGLLHLPTRKLLAHTPAFFTLNALPFGYNPAAPEPVEWLTFLKQLWPDDQAAIDTLQECSASLTGDTRHQKAFLLVGPKRSGKGTIARILTKLLGQANICGPTLSGLGTNFGLQPLIGKRLAIISDARISGRTDQSTIVERILSITGEDVMTIDRNTGKAGQASLRRGSWC